MIYVDNILLNEVISHINLSKDAIEKREIDIEEFKNIAIPLTDCPYGLFIVFDKDMNKTPVVGFKNAIKDQYGNNGCYDLYTGMPLRFDELGDTQYSKDAYKDILVFPLTSDVITKNYTVTIQPININQDES